jgi:hypothetical protein
MIQARATLDVVIIERQGPLVISRAVRGFAVGTGVDIIAVECQGRGTIVTIAMLVKGGAALARGRARRLVVGGGELAALAATAAQVAANLGDAPAARAGNALDVVLGAADQRAQGRQRAGD